MSDIALRFRTEIKAVLKELDFRIERTDHAVDPKEFQDQVLSWLIPGLKDKPSADPEDPA